jgi:hypothetical protein
MKIQNNIKIVKINVKNMKYLLFVMLLEKLHQNRHQVRKVWFTRNTIGKMIISQPSKF